MRWLTLAVGVAMIASGCSQLPFGAAPTSTPAPTPEPTAAPTATRAPAPPTATPAPKPTSTPEAAAAPSDTLWVGNTDGQGVYIRKTPVMADRLRAYPDGTPLTIAGEDVDGDNQHWRHVTTRDGLEGYVPSTYTVESPP